MIEISEQHAGMLGNEQPAAPAASSPSATAADDCPECRKRLTLKNDAQFRALVDSMGVGVGYYSPDGTALFFNRAAVASMGRRLEEMLGKRITDLFDRPQSLEFMRRMRSVIDTGAVQHFEDEVLMPAGLARWFSSAYSPVVDAHGTVLGVMVASMDITDRKLAELKSLESEDRFLTAFHANPALSTIADLETGRLIEANAAWLRCTGLTREEVVGRTTVELGLITAAQREELVAASMGSTPGQTIEVSFPTRHGGKLTVLWSGRVIDFGERKCLLASAIDVSQRAALERSLQLTQFCVDRVGESVFRFAKDGRVLYANQSAQELFGYDAEELARLTVFDLDPDLDRAAWATAWATAQRLEIRALPIKKDGRRFVAQVSFDFPQQPDPEFTFTFVRDITDRYETEKALRASEHRFRQMFGMMSSGVAAYQAIEGGADFLVTELNPAGERITSVRREDVIGRRATDVFPGMVPMGLLEILRRVWSTGETEKLSATHYVDDRLDLWVENVVYRLPDGEVIAVFDDVTEKQRVARELQAANESLRLAQRGMLHTLGAITEFRDPYTAGHQRRVARIAVAVGRRMGLSERRLAGLHAAATVHDIGKIAVPLEILSSPAALNPAQLQLIKEHALAGYEMLRSIEFEWPLAEMVKQHHERMDGSGYPNGISGERIMLEARILAVADTLEATMSHRPYRPALGIEVGLNELRAGKGTLYDPQVVDALLEVDIAKELAGESLPT